MSAEWRQGRSVTSSNFLKTRGNTRGAFKSKFNRIMDADDTFIGITYTALTWFLILSVPIIIKQSNASGKVKFGWLMAWPAFLAIWVSGLFFRLRFDVEPLTVGLAAFVSVAWFGIYALLAKLNNDSFSIDEMMNKYINDDIVYSMATFAFFIYATDLTFYGVRRYFSSNVRTTAAPGVKGY